MKKDLDLNEVEIAIATITHNLECIEEAEQEGVKVKAEKMRLKKLLNKYNKIYEEVTK